MDKTPEIWLEERKQQLINNYNQLNLRASGKWPTLLKGEVIERPDGIRVLMQGADYSQQMIKGRGQNTNQSPEAIRAWVGYAGSTFLAQWVKDKGLNMSPFAVAYEIARKGIRVPNRHNTGQLMKGVITDDTLTELLGIVGTAIINNLRDDLKPVGKTLVR